MSDEYLNKPFSEMTNEELVGSRNHWAKCVQDSPGWASAYEAAKYLKATCAEAARRGIDMPNPYPIVKGRG